MRFLIITLLIIVRVNTYAQELAYKQFTVKDGLPGSIVYYTLQDKNGFIWFATNQGASRFDGRTFTNYTKEDGLPDNEILKLYLDKYNNIWFISLTGIPAVFHNGTIKRFDNCAGVVAVCEDRKTDSIFLITNSNLYDKGVNGFYKSLNSSGKWQFAGYFKKEDQASLYNWPILRASSQAKINFYFSIINKKEYALWLKKDTLVRRYFFKTDDVGKLLLPFLKNSFFTLTKEGEGIIFYTDDSIYYADFHKISSVISMQRLRINSMYNPVNYLFCENDSTLWICTRNEGLLCIKNFLTPRLTIHSFLGKSFCTSIIKDQEQGYWVPTHGDGVYYLPDLSFHSLSAFPDLTNKNALCIKAIHKQVVAGFADGNIIIIENEGLQSRRFPEWAARNKSNHILDICSFRNNTLLLGSDYGLIFFSPRKTRKLNTLSVKALYLSDTGIFVGWSTCIALLNREGCFQKNLFFKRITCITGIGNQIYFGTLNGAFLLQHGAIQNLGQKYPVLSGTINHLDIAPDSALWISTQLGVAILKNSIVTLITKEQGLPGKMCKHVSFEGHTAWISTDKGISRLNYTWVQHQLNFSVSNITEEDGLISNDVNQTVPSGNSIWAATASGISFFSKNYTSHSIIRPRININKIVVDNQAVPVTDTIYVGYRAHKLLIDLSGISYRSGKQMRYDYRLKGLDSNWSNTINNSIEFPALPFGKFIFEVRAVDRWGITSDPSRSLFIIHEPPLWKTSWFLVVSYLVIAVLLACGFYIYYRRRQQQHEQEYELKKKIHNLEMMALRAQMNPHFIFNCLTSIQYYIIRADMRNANTYLHKFSTLIRQALQHSTDSSILLREEIKILKLYLDLEKMRMGSSMDYRMSVSDNLKQDDWSIPPMIVQPYIENAIKHGIAPLQHQKGVLHVEVTHSATYIEFVIEDNGPGIHVSAHDKRPYDHEYTSMGNSITASRIDAINAMQKNKILVQVTDKRQSGQATSGTIVHLSFPINPY
ncbi:hypothetical protein A4D02_18435 [Niastella koreensis]|uniref:Signal transduction histidine kinase n=2 Tax=Niastella koreensis TaxID=354356 RepID=A0ABX3NP33_9BACT|nr:histidine kinase [Niastella koreensis]AEV97006.1 putative signal transduction histidine kinase [Niastella koreensis GR20-10]OQP39300.1 hypothetical protein A4D02_18435 [Niastella koreensis]